MRNNDRIESANNATPGSVTAEIEPDDFAGRFVEVDRMAGLSACQFTHRRQHISASALIIRRLVSVEPITQVYLHA
jgi:hypothetical protein